MEFYQHKTFQKHTMPHNQDVYCGHCEHCDYEWWCQSPKAEAMTKRLHKKKCKKEGRSQEPQWRSRLLAERTLFTQAFKKSNIQRANYLTLQYY